MSTTDLIMEIGSQSESVIVREACPEGTELVNCCATMHPDSWYRDDDGWSWIACSPDALSTRYWRMGFEFKTKIMNADKVNLRDDEYLQIQTCMFLTGFYAWYAVVYDWWDKHYTCYRIDWDPNLYTRVVLPHLQEFKRKYLLAKEQGLFIPYPNMKWSEKAKLLDEIKLSRQRHEQKLDGTLMEACVKNWV